jgi:hypothetical protein
MLCECRHIWREQEGIVRVSSAGFSTMFFSELLFMVPSSTLAVIGKDFSPNALFMFKFHSLTHALTHAHARKQMQALHFSLHLSSFHREP